MYRCFKEYIREMVTIVEIRHIFGCLFDENGPVPLEEELKMFENMVTNIQAFTPLFKLRIIATGLKIVGRPHIKDQLDLCYRARELCPWVVGYDLVCEEDYNPPLADFLDILLEYKQKFNAQKAEKFEYYFHAGESTARKNTELFDALILGTKRIGHGFGLIKHPTLIEKVKEQNICVECCPVSNVLLCYVHDLRTHPSRTLLTRGVAVSISPDDPGFFDSPGVTLDYLVAYIAWDLDLSDLKKLCLNSLEHSSITDAEKVEVEEFFNYKWVQFLRYIRSNF